MIWTAYLDESGAHNGPVMLMAGFLGNTEQWSAFDRAWQSLLKSEQLKFCHAKNAGDALHLFELAKKEHLPPAAHLLGTLTFAGKNSCGLRTADLFAYYANKVERQDHGEHPSDIEQSDHVLSPSCMPEQPLPYP
jgi:hypothetical protein